jgi:manganese/zinc/iron transport system permease protein
VSTEAVIILTGALVGASCALVGTFLVLRRMALMGDAISHAVLAGIVAVFWLSGSRSALLMVLGAGAVGLLTVVLVEAVHRTGRVREDAAIGLVFPALFSIGVIAVSRFPSTVHLDVEHVLYGEIAYTPLDTVEWFGVDLGYRSLWVLGAMTLVNLLFVGLLYKELKLATFDPALAAALGFFPAVVHYGLMAAVSATTVVAFDSVGAILVVAMLVVPPATAYLLTDRLPVMLAIAVGCGAASAVGGFALARAVDGSIAGAMATVAGGLFALAFLVGPRHGVVARLARLRRLRRDFALSLLVSHLEGNHGSAELGALRRRFSWNAATARRIVGAATRQGLVQLAGGDRLALTERGRSAAREVPVP